MLSPSTENGLAQGLNVAVAVPSCHRGTLSGLARPSSCLKKFQIQLEKESHNERMQASGGKVGCQWWLFLSTPPDPRRSVLMDLIRTIFANRRASPGWAMPMGWFAWFGVMMPVMFGINGWLQNIVLAWAGWLTLWLTGLVGTAAIGYESVRNIRRFGFLAIGRPRFYFELSRATLAVAFLLWAPALTFALLLPNVNVPGVNFLHTRQLLGSLAALFCLMAVCGYLTSFLTGRRRHGRAYECASWFFCVFGGMAMVTFGYIAIPDPPQGLAPAMPGILSCCTGILLLSCGICAEAMRAKRTEPSDATEPGLQGFSSGKSTVPAR